MPANGTRWAVWWACLFCLLFHIMIQNRLTVLSTVFPYRRLSLEASFWRSPQVSQEGYLSTAQPFSSYFREEIKKRWHSGRTMEEISSTVAIKTKTHRLLCQRVPALKPLEVLQKETLHHQGHVQQASAATLQTFPPCFDKHFSLCSSCTKLINFIKHQNYHYQGIHQWSKDFSAGCVVAWCTVTHRPKNSNPFTEWETIKNNIIFQRSKCSHMEISSLSAVICQL